MKKKKKKKKKEKTPGCRASIGHTKKPYNVHNKAESDPWRDKVG